MWYTHSKLSPWEGNENEACQDAERRKTLNGATLKKSAAHGGCGECQTSCQSACKTSCTVANQKCENQ